MEHAALEFRPRVTQRSRRRARMLLGASLLVFAAWVAFVAFVPTIARQVGGSILLGMIVPLVGIAVGWLLILAESAYVRLGSAGLEVKLPGLNPKQIALGDIRRTEAKKQPMFGGFGFLGLVVMEFWRRLRGKPRGPEQLAGALLVWTRGRLLPRTFDLTFLAPEDFEQLARSLASRIRVAS